MKDVKNIYKNIVKNLIKMYILKENPNEDVTEDEMMIIDSDISSIEELNVKLSIFCEILDELPSSVTLTEFEVSQIIGEEPLSFSNAMNDKKVSEEYLKYRK